MIVLYPTVVELVTLSPGGTEWEIVGGSDMADCLVPGDDNKFLRLDNLYGQEVTTNQSLILSGWRVSGSNKNVKQLLDPSPSSLTRSLVLRHRILNYEVNDATSLFVRRMQAFGQSPLDSEYDTTWGGSGNNLRNTSGFAFVSELWSDKSFADADLTNPTNLNATVLRNGIWKLGLTFDSVIDVQTRFDLSEVRLELTETNPAAFKGSL